MKYTADLETTTDPNDCRVWAWGLCEINSTYKFSYGTDLTDFFNRFKKKSVDIYFHNLKFDGEFILYWLFNNGYEYRDQEDLEDNTFTTLISDMGHWYQIKICHKYHPKKPIYTTIFDSLKILPYSVDQTAKSFNLDAKKGSIDYSKDRQPGYVLDEEEIDYLKNDVTIMAKALKFLFDQDLDRMTTGANALKYYKKSFPKNQFEYTFPEPLYDQDVRQSYRGGFCYLMDEYKDRTTGEGIILDVNSLYPSVMYYENLPYGEPIWFEGEYVEDPYYPLYIQMVSFQFEIKPNHVPTIQIKKKEEELLFDPTDYLKSSENHEVTLALTNVDLQLIKEHYELYNVTYHSGYKFRATKGLFKSYIDKWMGVKVKAAEEGNWGMYVLSKLMLNSLYGKFATNPEVKSKVPVYNPYTNMFNLVLTEPEHRKPLYIPMAAFITAYARDKTIRTAQSVYHRFIYADTDSLYLMGKELPHNIEIHPTKLGAWSIDGEYKKAHFIRQKTNIKLIEKDGYEQLKITCAGMPDRCYDSRPIDELTGETFSRIDIPEDVNDHVTFDNFKLGAKFAGKLMPLRVPGGVVLEERPFTIIPGNRFNRIM